MRRLSLFARPLALSAALLPMYAAIAQTAPHPAAPPAPAFSADECAVFERELSFARSVAGHDAAAFADHVSGQAAFAASLPRPQRGRAAIVKGWSGLIDGSQGRLEWYPTRTTIAGAPDVAWSSGPALFEDTSPNAKSRYSMSQFRSVWHRDADGVWRVLFDDGVPPRPATEAEAAAFRAARPAGCPAG